MLIFNKLSYDNDMTEKEKMLCGQPYNASDKELRQQHLHAQQLCQRYNLIDPKNLRQRKALIRGLFKEVGVHFCIEQPFHCDYGFNISIGENFFSNYNVVILDCAEVSIGDNVLLGPNVSIFTSGHPVHPSLRNQGVMYAFPVRIGNNVWIGGNTVINPGVSIGDNTVIGAGTVVTKDIPANVVAAGNPCKILRTITDQDAQYYVRKMKF